MIVIPYVPGTFGSTVEYILRKFTQEGQSNPVDTVATLADGSMHGYKKTEHIFDAEQLLPSLIKFKGTDKILTPIYPLSTLHTGEFFQLLQGIGFTDTDKLIVIYIQDLKMAEINLLFQYYKISVGLGLGVESIFNAEAMSVAAKQWTDTTDALEDWEKREWFSITYPSVVETEWIGATDYIKSDKVSSTELLFETKAAIDKIIDYANLTKINHAELDEFIVDWQCKQQYIIDEYNDINEFVDCAIQNKNHHMVHKSIIAEAIIQQKLRAMGYEIRCYKLNKFPENACELHDLLERV